jgi:beta-aspartyl-peptidase (threonine type)
VRSACGLRGPKKPYLHAPFPLGMRRFVVAHGGTGSKPKDKDGTDAAVEAGWLALERASATEAVVAAVGVLEDDVRFNAGLGSSLRLDGQTIEMDAAVMDSRGRYGAVSVMQRVKNPILVAHALMGLPNNILAGPGATAFARRLGHPDFDPTTKKAQKSWRAMVHKIRKGEAKWSDNEWDLATLERCWNYERPFAEVFGGHHLPVTGGGPQSCDTVGAVACDGNSFAAAASTGGTVTTLAGRIGDTPAIGAGIFSSIRCAVACSGDGDHILRQRLATQVDRWLEEGMEPRKAIDRGIDLFPRWVDVCIALAHEDGFVLGAKKDLAWSLCDEGAVKNPKPHLHNPRDGHGDARDPARPMWSGPNGEWQDPAGIQALLGGGASRSGGGARRGPYVTVSVPTMPTDSCIMQRKWTVPAVSNLCS